MLSMKQNPLNIRIKLLKKGITYSDVARKCGTSRQLVRFSLLSKGEKKASKCIEIQKTISGLINISPEKLWPKIFKKVA